MSYTKVGSISFAACDELLKLVKASMGDTWKFNQGPDVDYRTCQNINVSDVEALHELWPVEDWHGAMFISIPAEGHIPAHTESCGVSKGDRGPWRKFHIPLQTSKQAVSRIGGKDYHLEVGSVYEIDFKQRHESFNHGPIDRIHLVMEIYE